MSETGIHNSSDLMMTIDGTPPPLLQRIAQTFIDSCTITSPSTHDLSSPVITIDDDKCTEFDAMDRQVQEMVLSFLYKNTRNEAILQKLAQRSHAAKILYLTHGRVGAAQFDLMVSESSSNSVAQLCSFRDYIAVHADWSLSRALQYVNWRRKQSEINARIGDEYDRIGSGNGDDRDGAGAGGDDDDDDENSIDLEMNSLMSPTSSTAASDAYTARRNAFSSSSSTPIGGTPQMTMVLVTDDEHWRVAGHIPLLDLISHAATIANVDDGDDDARDNDVQSDEPLVRDVMEALSSFRMNDNKEKAAMTAMKYRAWQELPVTGHDGELIGVVSTRSLMEDFIHSQLLSEGNGRIHGTDATAQDPSSGDDDEPNFVEASILSLFVKRIVWLVLLIFVNLISSGVIAAFEDTLSKNIALAFFIPLLIGTGGNVGTQASTLFIRALALKQVTADNIGRTLLREVAVSLCIGVMLGIFGSILGVARGGVSIAVVVSLTISVIVVLSDMIGTILPFIFHALRLDPAVAAGPVITTILDACGLVVYFGFAVVLLDVMKIGRLFGSEA